MPKQITIGKSVLSYNLPTETAGSFLLNYKKAGALYGLIAFPQGFIWQYKIHHAHLNFKNIYADITKPANRPKQLKPTSTKQQTQREKPMKNKYLKANFEVKSIDEEGVFEGYASIFDVVDTQNDVITKGAFSRSLREGADVKLLWQHKIEEPIGNFIQLTEDSRGLFVKGKLLLSLQKAREAYELLKTGAIAGMSIGYSVAKAEYDDINNIRVISDLDLFEVSLVTFPANEKALITSVKTGAPETIREFEKMLVSNGFSHSKAKAISAKGFQARDLQSKDQIEQLHQSFDRAVNSLVV